MKRISGVLFFLFLWAGFLHAQTLLTNELNKLISSDPLLKTSEVGIVGNHSIFRLDTHVP